MLDMHYETFRGHARIELRCCEGSLTGALDGLSITPFPAGRLIGSSVWRISWQGEVGAWRMLLLCTLSGVVWGTVTTRATHGCNLAPDSIGARSAITTVRLACRSSCMLSR